jgi:hypothetical protein
LRSPPRALRSRQRPASRRVVAFGSASLLYTPRSIYWTTLLVFCVYPSVVVSSSISNLCDRSPEEDAREDLEDETAEYDEAEEDWRLSESAGVILWRGRGQDGTRGRVLSQMGEMGDLGASLARFLIWSSDLPMRDSLSLANLRLALLCCGVCACCC